MPILPPQPQKEYFGLNTISIPEKVRDFETPDARNNDISQPGADKERLGMIKNHTTVKASPPMYHLMAIVTESEVQVQMYIDAAGNVVTF